MNKHVLKLFLMVCTLPAGPAGITQELPFVIAEDRSFNIQFETGDGAEIEPGGIVNIGGNGRLWAIQPSTEGITYQLICQNLSEQTVAVARSALEHPWFVVQQNETCNDWQNDLLVCPVAGMEKGIFCRIKEKTSVVVSDADAQVRLQTSVTVRGQGVQVRPFDLDSFVLAYQPAIDLCRDIHNFSARVAIEWLVRLDGSTTEIAVLTEHAEDNERQGAACIASEIRQWNFGSRLEESRYSRYF
ncbi:MAG: hypothetical protein RL120_14835 [Gammaproteobacteria bacterium]